ncbi:MAG: NAD(P)H-binding protein [Woeseiaceae bacterium]
MRLGKHTVAVLLLAAALAACSPTALLNGISPSSHFEVTSGIAYGDLEHQTLDIYSPSASRAAAPLIVYFYGGGWIKGKKEHFEFVASSLTEAGYVVVIADYRRFPEVVFPAFIEDGAAAVAWSLEHAGSYGADPKSLFLMGHSAGAHIAAMLSMDSSYLAAYSIDTGQIQGLVGLSGPYDFLPLTEGYLLDVFPEETREASQPVNYVTAEAPPTLLIHGTDDDIVYAANSESLAATLAENGVDVTLKLYEGAGHGAIVVALAPPLDFVERTLEDTRDFLTARSERPTEPLDIVVYGATGKVGSHVVTEALARGHRVRAVSRNPEQIELRHDNLSIVKGDLLDDASIAGTVADQDVVVLSVRGVIGDSDLAESALQYLAAEKLVDVLSQHENATRLIHVGGSGALEVRPGVLYAETLPKIALPKNLEVEIFGQIKALEFYGNVDDVEWTYLTPPKNFTNGPRTGVFRVGGKQALQDERGRTRLSRADFAVAIIDEAEKSQFLREQISIAY